MAPRRPSNTEPAPGSLFDTAPTTRAKRRRCCQWPGCRLPAERVALVHDRPQQLCILHTVRVAPPRGDTTLDDDYRDADVFPDPPRELVDVDGTERRA